jgi:hypothetical protein
LDIFKPVKKISLASSSTWGIDIRKDPEVIIVLGSELNKHAEIIFKDFGSREKKGFPNHNCTT